MLKCIPADGIILILLLTFVQEVRTLKNMQIGVIFRNYTNYEGRLADGRCCEGQSLNECPPDNCDTIFKICASHVNKSNCKAFFDLKTAALVNDDRAIFGQNIGPGKDNSPSLVVFFTAYSPEDIHFSIVAGQDRGKNKTLGEIASFNFTMDWMDYFYKDSPDVHQLLLQDLQAELGIDVFRQCMKTYYGPTCDIVCKTPKENDNYRCLTNGTKCCNEGWYGPDCNNNVCPAGHCKNGGTCVVNSGSCGMVSDTYVCQCPPPYTGTRCELLAEAEQMTPTTETKPHATALSTTIATIASTTTSSKPTTVTTTETTATKTKTSEAAPATLSPTTPMPTTILNKYNLESTTGEYSRDTTHLAANPDVLTFTASVTIDQVSFSDTTSVSQDQNSATDTATTLNASKTTVLEGSTTMYGLEDHLRDTSTLTGSTDLETFTESTSTQNSINKSATEDLESTATEPIPAQVKQITGIHERVSASQITSKSEVTTDQSPQSDCSNLTTSPAIVSNSSASMTILSTDVITDKLATETSNIAIMSTDFEAVNSDIVPTTPDSAIMTIGFEKMTTDSAAKITDRKEVTSDSVIQTRDFATTTSGSETMTIDYEKMTTESKTMAATNLSKLMGYTITIPIITPAKGTNLGAQTTTYKLPTTDSSTPTISHPTLTNGSRNVSEAEASYLLSTILAVTTSSNPPLDNRSTQFSILNISMTSLELEVGTTPRTVGEMNTTETLRLQTVEPGIQKVSTMSSFGVGMSVAICISLFIVFIIIASVFLNERKKRKRTHPAVVPDDATLKSVKQINGHTDTILDIFQSKEGITTL